MDLVDGLFNAGLGFFQPRPDVCARHACGKRGLHRRRRQNAPRPSFRQRKAAFNNLRSSSPTFTSSHQRDWRRGFPRGPTGTHPLLHIFIDPILLDFLVFALIDGGAAFGPDAPADAAGDNFVTLIAINAFRVNNHGAEGEFAFLFQNIDGAERAGNRLVDFNGFEPEPVPAGVERMNAGRPPTRMPLTLRMALSEHGGR